MNKIDLSYLNEISAGDNAFIKEMLELFLNTTAIEVNEFDNHLANANFEAIGLLAHKMKAPIQMMGVNDLFDKIKSIENNCKNSTNLESIPNLITEVKLQINTISEDIKTILTKMD